MTSDGKTTGKVYQFGLFCVVEAKSREQRERSNPAAWPWNQHKVVM